MQRGRGEEDEVGARKEKLGTGEAQTYCSLDTISLRQEKSFLEGPCIKEVKQ